MDGITHILTHSKTSFRYWRCTHVCKNGRKCLAPAVLACRVQGNALCIYHIDEATSIVDWNPILKNELDCPLYIVRRNLKGLGRNVYKDVLAFLRTCFPELPVYKTEADVVTEKDEAKT